MERQQHLGMQHLGTQHLGMQHLGMRHLRRSCDCYAGRCRRHRHCQGRCVVSASPHRYGRYGAHRCGRCGAYGRRRRDRCSPAALPSQCGWCEACGQCGSCGRCGACARPAARALHWEGRGGRLQQLPQLASRGRPQGLETWPALQLAAHLAVHPQRLPSRRPLPDKEGLRGWSGPREPNGAAVRSAVRPAVRSAVRLTPNGA